MMNKYWKRKSNHTLAFIGLGISIILNFLNNVLHFMIFPFEIFVSIFLFYCLSMIKLSHRESTVPIYISNISYGVYLSHFLLISFFCKVGLEKIQPIEIEPFIMVSLVLLMECAIFYIIGKTRLKKYLM